MSIPHHATRTVRLPESWENAPRDIQVNYYNYLAKRLIHSTDIYIGDRLVYRTNAVACRGDDLQPGQPVLLIVGDEVVHGDLAGSFTDQIAIGACRVLNGGVEALPLAHAIDRFNELTVSVRPVAGILVLPRRELIPEVNRVTKAYDGDWEADWQAQLDRIQGPAVMALLTRGRGAPALEGEDAEPILERFDRFVEEWSRRKGVTLLAPGAPEGGRAGLGRKLGFGPRTRPGLHPLAALVEERLAKPLLAYLKAHPMQAAPAPAAAAEGAPGAHGPEDVGRNYPLW